MSVLLMPDKLRPCPFCGGEAELRAFYQNKADRRRTRIVVCKACGVRTKDWTQSRHAIKQWNGRVYEAETKEADE